MPTSNQRIYLLIGIVILSFHRRRRRRYFIVLMICRRNLTFALVEPFHYITDPTQKHT